MHNLLQKVVEEGKTSNLQKCIEHYWDFRNWTRNVPKLDWLDSLEHSEWLPEECGDCIEEVEYCEYKLSRVIAQMTLSLVYYNKDGDPICTDFDDDETDDEIIELLDTSSDFKEFVERVDKFIETLLEEEEKTTEKTSMEKTLINDKRFVELYHSFNAISKAYESLCELDEDHTGRDYKWYIDDFGEYRVDPITENVAKYVAGLFSLTDEQEAEVYDSLRYHLSEPTLDQFAEKVKNYVECAKALRKENKIDKLRKNSELRKDFEDWSLMKSWLGKNPMILSSLPERNEDVLERFEDMFYNYEREFVEKTLKLLPIAPGEAFDSLKETIADGYFNNDRYNGDFNEYLDFVEKSLPKD